MWCNIEVELSENILLNFEVEYEYEAGKLGRDWDPGVPTEFGIQKFVLDSVCIDGIKFDLSEVFIYKGMSFAKTELSEAEFGFFFDSVDDEVERLAIEEDENQREMQYEIAIDRLEFKQDQWR